MIKRCCQIALLWLPIGGCHDYYTTEEHNGAFVARNYMYQQKNSLRTGSRYIDFCNLKTGDCFRNDYKKLIAGVSMVQKEYLFAQTNNKNGIQLGRREIMVFRRLDGFELECENCEQYDFRFPADRFAVLTHRHASGSDVAQAIYDTSAGKRFRVFIVSFNADKYTVKLFYEVTAEERGNMSLFYGTASNKVAWIDCRGDCMMFVEDIATGDRTSTEVPQCKGRKPLRFDWVDGEPIPDCDIDDGGRKYPEASQGDGAAAGL